MVYILLGKGFEEIEAVTPGDLLRRAGVETAYVGLGGLEVTGSHGMTVRADLTLEQMDLTQLDMIVLPGGLGGVASIRGCRQAMEAVRFAYENRAYHFGGASHNRWEMGGLLSCAGAGEADAGLRAPA